MEIGMYGLGRMGVNMAQRLIRAGHRVVGTSRTDETVRQAQEKGVEGAFSIAEMLGKLPSPHIVWMMIPAGGPVDKVLEMLVPELEGGDIIIDGGNSYYKETIRRANTLADRGIHFVDAGTSGGIWGLEAGYSMMIGGEQAIVDKLRPLFEALAPAPDKGWGHVGPNGAGHFTKMVHNGIEYGMMQAYAEGLQLLEKKAEFDLDLHQVAEVWRHGSVVRSWLLDLIARALEENPKLEGVAPYVADSGEGRWTVMEGIELDCPLPVITLSLMNRFSSREESPFRDKLLAEMRRQFGGHEIKKSR